MLPYETIVKATAGEPEAVNTVIQTYTGYIKYLSYFQGGINDDIQDYLKAQLMEALPKFDSVKVFSQKQIWPFGSRQSTGYDIRQQIILCF